MFDYESPKPKEPVDYTGLKIVAILAPVFFLITFLANADMGLTACIVLAMIMLAIKIHWYLRKHVWFWAIIAVILAFHVPLVFMVRWPQGHAPTLFYTMPIGIADFVIISGALKLAEQLFSKGSSPNDENE
jgi:4-amino-4-deoxy-L-arabinose transferase-like glycosyltransferase